MIRKAIPVPAKTPIDRPFRSRAALEKESALVAQYRAVANPELQMMQGSGDTPRAPGDGGTDGRQDGDGAAFAGTKPRR